MVSLGRVAFVCAVVLSCSRPDAGELFSEPLSQSGASSSTNGGTSAAHAGNPTNGGTRAPSSGGSGGGSGKPSGPMGASGAKGGNRSKAESGTGNSSTESVGAGGWMEAQGGAPDLGGRSGASGSSGRSGASGASGAVGTGGSSGSAGTAGKQNGGTGGTEEPVCDPEPERCDGLDNDCDDVVDLDACPNGCVGATRPEDGHLYLLCYTAPLDWFAAQEYCASQGAALVEIDSSAENQFLSEQLLRLFIEVGDAAWIGASDRDHEGEWGWYRPNGSTPFFDGNSPGTGNGFNAWREGEPNNQNEDEHCASIEHTEDDGPWLWNDRSCEDELPAFACEHL